MVHAFMEDSANPSRGDGTTKHRDRAPRAVDTKPIPWFRCAVGGLLMGLANLVPGVSGGTMILIMGLYDEFISAVDDVSPHGTATIECAG